MLPEWITEQARSTRFFDRVRFAFRVVERFVMPEYREALARLALPPRQRVLDIGTGSGALATVLAERGHMVHGIDSSGRLLERARKRVPGATFELATISELARFDDASFELASLGFVLHGLSAGLRQHALRQAARIAGGKVLILDYGPRRSWMIDLVERFEGPHYFEYIRIPFNQCLEEAGLACSSTGETTGGTRWWLTQMTPDPSGMRRQAG